MRRALLLALLGVTALAAAKPAPQPFSATTLDGASFALADLKGQVVLVNFWATWCAPCRIEMPALDAYYRAHKGRGLAMVAVSIEEGAKPARLRAATSAFAFPVARIDDTRMARRDIPTAVPVTQIYDRSGALAYDNLGTPLDAAALERIVTPLLAKPTTTR